MERMRTAIARPVAILRYLAIHPRPSDPSISVDTTLFVDQLDALLDCGYVPLSISDVVTAITIITFDQGLQGFYDYALPALRNRDIPSTTFVTIGFVGHESRALVGSTSEERSAMTWSQLRDLNGEDVAIGSNGHSYRPLDVMKRSEASEELALSRSLLEHQLERHITTVAFPASLASPSTRSAAIRVGYRAACVLRGTVSSNYDEISALRRMPMDGLMRPEILIAHLEVASRRLPTTRESIRSRAHRTIRRAGMIRGVDSMGVRSQSARSRRTGRSTRNTE